MIDVLGDGISFVNLTKHVGSELDIVNAARVSFHNESDWDYDNQQYEVGGDSTSGYKLLYKLNPRDAGLIKFLLKNHHGSPFEQGFVSFWHMRLPIFVMRELVRHRIGHSVNEESGRYVEMRDDFFVPSEARTQVGKPGSYSYEPLPMADRLLQNTVTEQADRAWTAYTTLLNAGVAKEQARIVLPLNLYTEIRWTANARSLMHFLALRNDPNAQREIRLYAEAMETIFAKHMPTVHAAFVDAGRISP